MQFPHNAGGLLLDLAQGQHLPTLTADIFELAFQSILEYTPRARGAHNERERFRATDGIPGYHAEEKLDGMYVLWTGYRLVSKRGKPIRNTRFTHLLPPFPLVGELYSGNGHHRRADHVVSKAEGQAVVTQNLSDTWAALRLVAFDVPGMDDWEYQERHTLLCHVVAAWSKYCVDHHWVRDRHALPLYVMIRHPIAKLANLFRAICEGHTWEDRRQAGLLPFGIPEWETFNQSDWKFGTCSLHLVDGQSLHLAKRDPLGSFHWMAMPDPFVSREHGRHSGEGCMLWQDAGRWEARGPSSKFTSTVIKYKPVMLLAAMTISAPYHSHFSAATEEKTQEERLPGYHIQLLWHSVDDARYVFKSWIPPQKRDVAFRFPMYKHCFVQTVVYPPRLGRVVALGRQLEKQEALAVLEHAYHLWDLRKRAREGAGYQEDAAPPPLYRLSNAENWNMGELRALFPCDCSRRPLSLPFHPHL